MGSTWQETGVFLDELTDLAAELQSQTGVKLLWATCNLFANPIYASGASTNPDSHVFAMAAAQVKKGLESAKKLGAEGFGRYMYICTVIASGHGNVKRCTCLCSVLGRP